MRANQQTHDQNSLGTGTKQLHDWKAAKEHNMAFNFTANTYLGTVIDHRRSGASVKKQRLKTAGKSAQSLPVI